MSGELDAAGDAITGALLARTIEPRHGEARRRDAKAADDAAAHAGTCSNCGTPTDSPYCGQCGQAAHVHRSFAAIGHDLLHGVLHLDGKIFRTLPELALRPGHLTRRYIRGERAKFVSPFALFLFSAFLLYAVYSLTATHSDKAAAEVKVGNEAAREVADDLASARTKLKTVETQLAASDLSAGRREALEDEADELRGDIAGLSFAEALVTGKATGSGLKSVGGTVGRALGVAQENPEFAYYKLKANAYKFSWALILISIPFVWLLFPFRRGYHIYDHAIYTTYSISFMSLLFSAQMVANGMGQAGGLFSFGLLLFAAWHMYRQMKDAYQLSRTGALLRLPLLYLFVAISLALFYALVVGLS